MCFQCNSTFDHPRLYKMHMEKHPPIDLVSDSDSENKMGIKRRASECSTGRNVIAISSSLSDYSNDSETSDSSVERPFKCDTCARQFKTKGQLKRHIERHKANQRNKKKANLECLECNRVFLVRPHLIGHKCLGRRKSYIV